MSWFSLDWSLTLFGLAFGVFAFFYSSHRAGLPRDDLKPRMLPWRLFIVVSAFWVVLMFVHAVNLLGVETGPEHSPFGRF